MQSKWHDRVALLETYARIAALEPADAEAPRERARRLFELGRKSQAQEGIEAVLAVHPRDLESRKVRFQIVSGYPADVDPALRDFKGLDLDRTYFTGAMLRGSSFSGAIFGASSGFSGADLREAKFSGQMYGWDLSEARLEGADFSAVTQMTMLFSGARYSAATRWPERFDPRKFGAVLVK